MNGRKLAKLDALKNRLIFSAYVRDTGVGREKRGIEDTTVDGMKINRDDLSHAEDPLHKAKTLTDNAITLARKNNQEALEDG